MCVLQVVFTKLGVVLAMTFVSFPFVVRTMQPVLYELEKELEEAAWTLGASPWRTFTDVRARPGGMPRVPAWGAGREGNSSWFADVLLQLTAVGCCPFLSPCAGGLPALLQPLAMCWRPACTTTATCHVLEACLLYYCHLPCAGGLPALLLPLVMCWRPACPTTATCYVLEACLHC